MADQPVEVVSAPTVEVVSAPAENGEGAPNAADGDGKAADVGDAGVPADGTSAINPDGTAATESGEPSANPEADGEQKEKKPAPKKLLGPPPKQLGPVSENVPKSLRGRKLSVFQQAMHGEKFEKKYVEFICDGKTSFDVEKWVTRIFHMDPKGAVKQLKQLGILEGHAGGPERAKTGPVRDDNLLKKAPFNLQEKEIVDRHIAKRVKELVADIEKEFNVENRYLNKIKQNAGIAPDEVLLGIPPVAAASSQDVDMDEESSPNIGGGATPTKDEKESDENKGKDDKLKGPVSRNIEVLELRLGHLKRDTFRKRLRKNMLLYVEEGEKLVYDKRWEYEKARQDRADAAWDSAIDTMGEKGVITQKKKQLQSRILRGVELKVEKIEEIPVSKMSTVYDYINTRYTLENSKSSRRINARKRAQATGSAADMLRARPSTAYD